MDLAMHLQTETIMSAVDSSRSGGSKVSGPATATSKLGSAVRQENDRYINTEGDRQTLLVRWVPLLGSPLVLQLSSLSCASVFHDFLVLRSS